MVQVIKQVMIKPGTMFLYQLNLTGIAGKIVNI